MKNNRRNFIKTAAVGGIGLAMAPNIAFGKKQKESKVRIGFIGLGLRGVLHLKNCISRQDVEITALCDINPLRLDLAQQIITDAGLSKAKLFGDGDYDYQNLIQEKDVDAVIISTPWLWHTPMTVDSMKAGKYAGVEVSAATSLEEC